MYFGAITWESVFPPYVHSVSLCTYGNKDDGKTQTGQEDAKNLKELCQSTVTESINTKNNAAQSELGNRFCCHFKEWNLILELFFFLWHFWQILSLFNSIPTSYYVFSGMTSKNMKWFIAALRHIPQLNSTEFRKNRKKFRFHLLASQHMGARFSKQKSYQRRDP